MMRFINAITGRRFWYSVRCSYHKGTRELFCWHAEIGCVQQGDILHARQIKTLVALKLLTPDARPYLCNGHIKIQPTCYLGKFRKPEKCATAITVTRYDILVGMLLEGLD
jgi:hypothetical protein